MKDLQKALGCFVKELIASELNEIQQEQFAIEGDEIIQALFIRGSSPVYAYDKHIPFDFGISPSALEMQAIGVTFVDIIETCFFLIERVRTHKASLNPDYNAPSFWRKALEERKINLSLVNLLCGPYKEQLANIIKLEL